MLVGVAVSHDRPPAPARTELLPLDVVEQRIGEVSRSYLGVRAIPLAAVIGTLDRASRDFDRSFRPRRAELRQRLRSVRRRYPDGDFPPIQVVELGGAYFVIDGHHRVALARELGMRFVDAEITSVRTAYELPPDVDIATLVHTDAHRRFHRDSGLAAVPQAAMLFSRPQGYPELLEVIRAWGYERSLRAGVLLPPEEVAARWFAEVYRPALTALHTAELPAAYRYKTDTDLFLWVHQLLRAMLLDRPEASYLTAAGQARRQRVPRSFKRRFRRHRTTPLTPQR